MLASPLVVALQGMHCASCVVSIERALKKTPGVYDATVNLATQQPMWSICLA